MPALSALGEQTIAALAASAEEVRVEAGTAVVREGETGDRAYVIAAGAAEASVTGKNGPVPVAALRAGEIFGELAIFSEARTRAATVTATTALDLYSISGPALRRLREGHPEVKARFDDAARLMMRARFIKLAASPFAGLPAEHVRDLAARLQTLTVAAGTDIVRQGDEGDRCFIIVMGQVEVVLRPDNGDERTLATLGPEAVFGEAALLTSAPRNATARALEPCELLVLRRDDLIEVMSRDARSSGHVRELLKLRVRPIKAAGVVAVTNTNLSGEAITILKDPARHTYYRLSAPGWFIWQRLDGNRSLKDLTLDYMREFKAFAPQAVIEIVSGLTQAGFARTPALRADVAQTAQRPSAAQRFIAASRAILEWQIALKNVDGALTRIYRSGIHLLYSRAAQIVMAVLAAAGLLAFLVDADDVGRTVSASSPWLLAALVPAQIVALLVHEAGHAFTTKAVGREVHSVGIGWYWFGMVAFVDTSDTWLATRWQRVAVNCAGPYANLVLGSALALGAHAVAGETAQAVLWQFALVSYIGVVMNLNPLMEFDGYYILTDLMDRPNLRRQTLAWLGTRLLPALAHDRKALRAHLFDIAFGMASIVYVAVMAVMTMVLYRVFLEGWLGNHIPAAAASVLAWVVGAAVVVFSAAGIAGDMKSQPASA